MCHLRGQKRRRDVAGEALKVRSVGHARHCRTPFPQSASWPYRRNGRDHGGWAQRNWRTSRNAGALTQSSATTIRAPRGGSHHALRARCRLPFWSDEAALSDGLVSSRLFNIDHPPWCGRVILRRCPLTACTSTRRRSATRWRRMPSLRLLAPSTRKTPSCGGRSRVMPPSRAQPLRASRRLTYPNVERLERFCQFLVFLCELPPAIRCNRITAGDREPPTSIGLGTIGIRALRDAHGNSEVRALRLALSERVRQSHSPHYAPRTPSRPTHFRRSDRQGPRAIDTRWAGKLLRRRSVYSVRTRY